MDKKSMIHNGFLALSLLLSTRPMRAIDGCEAAIWSGFSVLVLGCAPPACLVLTSALLACDRNSQGLSDGLLENTRVRLLTGACTALVMLAGAATLAWGVTCRNSSE